MTKSAPYRLLLTILLMGSLIPVCTQSHMGTLNPAHIQSPAYSFIVAGHAYGSHEGENLGLHPPFLASLEAGRDSLAAFAVLTGDIVNHSTPESWEQVEKELDSLHLPAFYVMGNHDMNITGQQVFQDKHGGTYYAFRHDRELFVVLNSTEADRAISATQLAFLDEQLLQAGDSTRSVFVFFHEIIWNSHESYMDVRSNSRSRYGQMKYHSNYWEEVHPLLTARPELPIYLIGGDMGGNPDAMAAFYDKWDNVTLLASGMGEVADENYLLVRVNSLGEIRPSLVALDPGVQLPAIEEFSVPPAPDSIVGPGQIMPGSVGNHFEASQVPGATAYSWELPPGLSGSNQGSLISLDADMSFPGGRLKVRAERDGFGWGPESMRFIDVVYPLSDRGPGVEARNPGMDERDWKKGKNGLTLENRAGRIVLSAQGLEGEEVILEIFDGLGRLMNRKLYLVHSPDFTLQVPVTALAPGSRYITATTTKQTSHNRPFISVYYTF